MENKNTLFVIGNSLAVIFTIIVNALANILPINGKNTGELSDKIPNLFVPAGLTFAIWGVIYVLIILFMLYQINDVIIKKKDSDYVGKIGFYFMLASLANIIWIFMWHYEQVTLSILPMLVLFISLLMIYQRLEIGKTKTSLKEKMFIHTPISVYIGWITVATIANVTAVLVVNKAGDLLLGEMAWTMLVIFVATFITVLILKNRNDIAYSLVIIWALLGIILKRFKVNQSLEIAYTAGVCIIIIAVTILIMFYMHNSKTTKS
jgi:benzodiazapine receptor